ncbi:TonB-dependent receptor [Polaribacter reichenbachii]|uniref:TonB-dependent receptor n=1 Tax=Polaribacter reichenbachii TaxID=996801 RepID=A0A1B8U4T1_9FLAO|nr:TonB-dependent receptor [Polaribacter reichenbachii]APZ44891.1 TonB-dependent receptor [Polaribacter reichenbachii]AUC18755.1 TonB-dependent receptor [Polaribacter reichenbachii]OBY66870.1 TonB-dependent receptor [Polaribacter reichenbachii]
MKRILFLLFTITQFSLLAQTTISGKVTDSKKQPILGASVYLEGTYDGTSTNEKGEFLFTSEETGTQTLVISFVSFETFVKIDDVSAFKNLQVKLRDDVNSLDAVTINAGTFKAGEKAKVTVLKPLDIVTTASAVGDVLGALQTLPGTSSAAEDGRLFVRGGNAEETQIFIDGVRVFTPYSPSPNNAPTRGRYSPFLFKGITFSTGGYSAEYGQALSGVLDLTTIDKPDQEKTDISLMTVGVGVGNTQIWGKNSLSVNASYINLDPYTAAFPDRNQWLKPYQAASGEAVYRHSFKDDSMLKIYGAFSYTDLDVIQDDINFEDGFRFGLQNRNLYINSTYKNKFGNNWKIESGVSFTNDNSTVKIIDDVVNNTENSAHFKAKIKKQFSSRFRIAFGSEYFITDFNEDYTPINHQKFAYGFNNNLFASFAETDIFFSKNLAAKIGVRAENSDLLNQFTISPRASLSYKSGKNSQLSLAYGQFYQNPNNSYLKFNQDFKAENTTHLIANYQHTKKNQIFRIEAYYKDYKDLVKYDSEIANFDSNFSNNGSAYAKGIDIFWRQNQKIKNTDYWVSYSFLDTERDYRNYTTSATPNFASAHNLSIVGKHWIEKLKSQVGITYNFASGRTYTNPNEPGFLNNKTKSYNSVSLNWAYLIDQQKILYFSVNNALGTKNVFGYNYKNTPNVNGNFDRQAVVPNADRFFFVGFFWTISTDKKSNQLNNL